MRKFSALILLIAPFTSANQIDACDEADTEFIHSKIEKSQNYISYVPFELDGEFEGLASVQARWENYIVDSHCRGSVFCAGYTIWYLDTLNTAKARVHNNEPGNWRSIAVVVAFLLY
ncbi:MAG: hypothetical protein HWE26_06835 [Alteromonadaceae bacterium]|nr:hypothetical protein [Alteromonadaceae bacterium]